MATKLHKLGHSSTFRMQGIPGDTTEKLLDRVEVRVALPASLTSHVNHSAAAPAFPLHLTCWECGVAWTDLVQPEAHKCGIVATLWGWHGPRPLDMLPLGETRTGDGR
jgi:hypothetical protein